MHSTSYDIDRINDNDRVELMTWCDLDMMRVDPTDEATVD